MTERKVYAYRLKVTYPPGSLESGWEPPGWEAEISYTYEGLEEDGFRWPQNRLCFSASTARRRADLFRKYEATVTIERSEPVTWPGSTMTPASPAQDAGDKLWNEAVDWLLNSRHTADPDIQKAFWGMVEGKYTRDQADRGHLLGEDSDG